MNREDVETLGKLVGTVVATVGIVVVVRSGATPKQTSAQAVASLWPSKTLERMREMNESAEVLKTLLTDTSEADLQPISDHAARLRSLADACGHDPPASIKGDDVKRWDRYATALSEAAEDLGSEASVSVLDPNRSRFVAFHEALVKSCVECHQTFAGR